MKQSYRILLLEDSASDAELTAIQLTKIDLKFKLVIVSTKKEFDQEFYSETPDLVICDYNLPTYTGIDILKEVRDFSEDLPFILVSGYMDVSVATEAMVKGASDYVMKDNLSRLAPAAKRELIYYSEKRKQQRLLDEAYKLASIGYWEYRLESKALFWSDQVKRVYDVSLDVQPDFETSLSFFKEGKDRKTITEAVENARLFGESFDVEVEIISAKSNSKWIRVLGQAEMDQGKCLRIFGSTQDVTKGKVAEIDLKEAHHDLEERVKEKVCLHEIITLREDRLRLDELLSKAVLLIPSGWQYPEITEARIKYKDKVYATDRFEPSKHMLNSRTEGGSVGELEITISLRESDEEISFIEEEEQLLEIIARHLVQKIEYILGEQNLKKARELMGQMSQLAKIGYWELDLKNETVIMSKMTKEIHDVDPEFIPTLENALDFYPEGKHRDLIKKVVEDAITNGTRYDVEVLFRTAKDRKLWVRAIGEPQFINGECVRLTGSFQDVTKQKKNQDKLEMLSKVASETQNMVIITDNDGRIEWVNKALEQKTGYKLTELLGKPPLEVLTGPKTDSELTRKHIEKVRNGESFTATNINYTKSGEPFWTRMNISPIFDEDRKVKKYFSIMEDITKEVEFSNQLQQKSLRLENSQKIGDIGDWYFDLDTGETFWSDHMYAIYERDHKAAPGYEQLKSYYPDEWERHEEAIQNAVQKGKPYSFDIRMITEKGKEKFIRVEGRPVKDDNGKVYRLNGTAMDITTRKKAELELKNREEQLKNITNNIDGMIQQYKRNIDGTYEYLYVSEGIQKLHGLSPEQAYSSSATISEQVIEEDKASVLSSMEKSAQSLEQWDNKYRVRLPDGTLKWIHGKGTPKRLEDGSVIWNTIKMDITEQLETKELLEQAYQLARIGVWEFEPQKGNVYWSSVTREIHEAPPGFEPDLESDINFYAEGESRDLIQKCVTKAIEKGVSWDEELQIVTLNGNIKWIRTKGAPEFKEGKCQRIYGTIQDIHERKDAQLKVIQGFKERERILDRIAEGFFTVNKNWTITYWNGMAENIMEKSRTEVLDQNLWDIFPEAKDLKFFQKCHQAIDAQKTVSFEEYFPPLDMWIEANAYPSDDGLSIFFRNITSRKLREKKLEDSLQEKETLLMEIHHRVKNNLAVVSGLMQLQAFSSDNEVLREHLNASVNRIQTIASIHELLYSSNSFSRLDTDQIAKKLIIQLIQTFGGQKNLNTKFELQNVKLNINQAIPLSLIINEVVTNILKHAFTEKEQGTITCFISESDQMVTLRITDNGKGLSKGFPDNFKTKSLGLQLIETLSSQLNADYSYDTNNELTHFTLTFEKKEIKGSSSALLQ